MVRRVRNVSLVVLALSVLFGFQQGVLLASARQALCVAFPPLGEIKLGLDCEDADTDCATYGDQTCTALCQAAQIWGPNARGYMFSCTDGEGFSCACVGGPIGG